MYLRKGWSGSPNRARAIEESVLARVGSDRVRVKVMRAPLLRYFVEESLGSKGLYMRLMPVRLPAILGAVVLAWEHAGSMLGESV